MIDKAKRICLGSKKRVMISLIISFIFLSIILVYTILISELPDITNLNKFSEELEAMTELDKVEEIEVLEKTNLIETDEYEVVQITDNPFASLLEEEVIVQEADMSRAEPDEADLQRQRERRIEDEIRSDYNVTGLIEQTHSIIAMVQRGSDGQTFMLREGEGVDDIIVEAIRDKRVRISKDGVGVVYNLREEED